MDVRVGDEAIRRYLLDDITELEHQRMEERVLRDYVLFEHVCAVEDDLIDEYLRDELPEHARKQFETGYLASPVQRDKVELARALQKSVFNSAHAAPRHGTLSESVWAGVSLGTGWFRWGLAAAAVSVVAIGALLLSNEHRVEPAGDRQAQQPLHRPPIPSGAKRPEPAPGGRASTVLAVTLTPGLLRDPGGGNRVNVEARIETLRFVLEVDSGVSESRYRVTIETAERKRVWTRDDAERAATGEPTVIFDAPSSAFPDADYIVFLQARNAGAGIDRFHDVHEYFFSVRRNPSPDRSR